MHELIAALRADPRRRRRAAASVAAVALAVIVAAIGAERVATRGKRMCQGATDKLAGIWELDPKGTRRTSVHDSFLHTGSALAEETWTRVSSLIDDYARRWTAAYTDTCEATHVRGDQSEEVLDLRMSCLDGARVGLRALGDVLSHADGRTVIEAVNGANGLRPIDRCADIAALRTAVPPPASPAARARVAELEGRLAEVKALSDTGQWPEARRRVGPLVDAARGAGYKPLLAEALEAESWLELQLGDFAPSAKTLEETVWVALKAHRDDIAAESAAQLMEASLESSGLSEERERWEWLATALLRRLGPGHDRIAAWFHQDRVDLLLRRGDLKGADKELSLALSLKRRVLPPNHPDIAVTLSSMAFLHAEIGDGDAALISAEHAVDIYRAAYGDQSPLLFGVLDSRGCAFQALHRYKEAENDLRASLALAEALLGPDHVWTADPSSELGKTLVAEGRYGEALPLLEKALRLRERADATSPDLPETRFALARARWALGRDRAGARALAIAARAGYQAVPGFKRWADEIEVWLSDKTPAAKETSRK
jgi:tetratricopeptide (TPR) repeat protein